MFETIKNIFNKKPEVSLNPTEPAVPVSQDCDVVTIKIRNTGSIKMTVDVDVMTIHPALFISAHSAVEAYLRTANILYGFPVQSVNVASFELMKLHAGGASVEDAPATRVVNDLTHIKGDETGPEFR